MVEIGEISYKSEQGELPTQIRLVEHRIGEQFAVLEEDQRIFGVLTDGFSHGLEFRGNEVIFPWEGKQVNFKEKYPVEYQNFLKGLREVRKFQKQAVLDFLDPEKSQNYPVFLPIWHNPEVQYNDAALDNDWVNNTDQEYFLDYQFSSSQFNMIPDSGKVFYSHCATGLGIESFARSLPKTKITAGDINDEVRKKCKSYLLEKKVENVVSWCGSPAEYLSLESGEFDAVFTHEAIWINPYRAFSEYVRVVKSGGVIVGSGRDLGNHDTIVFFKNFSDIYEAEMSLSHNDDFTLVSVEVSDNVKDKFDIDRKILDVLYKEITPKGDDSDFFPDEYSTNFTVYDLNKEEVLRELKNLGMADNVVTSSLKRLEKVAKGLSLTTESSYNAVAVQLKNLT